MDKKKRKVYTPAEKRRRNRRHNAIVTSIAVVLMLAGIIIIVSDTTFFFDDAGRWIRRNIFGEVFETIPPFPTGSPSEPSDPDDPNNPNIGPQGSLVPRPTFSPDETPLPENVTEEPFIYDYAPECVYFPQYDITCPVDPVGYNWRGDGSSSEHCLGTALDINWEENYMCTKSGAPLTGSYWKPGEDAYSIPANGEVVRIFAKYGFGWGGTWNSKKDYMHFSYFGT